MKKYLLIIISIISCFSCFGQDRNNIYSLVEDAVFNRDVKSISSAYGLIVQGKSINLSGFPTDKIAKSLSNDEIAIEFFELPESSGGSNYLVFLLKHGMSSP